MEMLQRIMRDSAFCAMELLPLRLVSRRFNDAVTSHPTWSAAARALVPTSTRPRRYPMTFVMKTLIKGDRHCFGCFGTPLPCSRIDHYGVPLKLHQDCVVQREKFRRAQPAALLRGAGCTCLENRAFEIAVDWITSVPGGLKASLDELKPWLSWAKQVYEKREARRKLLRAALEEEDPALVLNESKPWVTDYIDRDIGNPQAVLATAKAIDSLPEPSTEGARRALLMLFLRERGLTFDRNAALWEGYTKCGNGDPYSVAGCMWEMDWLMSSTSYKSERSNERERLETHVDRSEKHLAYSNWIRARFDAKDYRLVREMEPALPSFVWDRVEQSYRKRLFVILQLCSNVPHKNAAQFWRYVDETHPAGPETAKYSLSRLAKSLLQLESPII